MLSCCFVGLLIAGSICCSLLTMVWEARTCMPALPVSFIFLLVHLLGWCFSFRWVFFPIYFGQCCLLLLCWRFIWHLTPVVLEYCTRRIRTYLFFQGCDSRVCSNTRSERGKLYVGSYTSSQYFTCSHPTRRGTRERVISHGDDCWLKAFFVWPAAMLKLFNNWFTPWTSWDSIPRPLPFIAIPLLEQWSFTLTNIFYYPYPRLLPCYFRQPCHGAVGPRLTRTSSAI